MKAELCNTDLHIRSNYGRIKFHKQLYISSFANIVSFLKITVFLQL